MRRRLRRRPQRRKLGRWLLGAAAVLAAGLFLLPGEPPPQQPLPPAPAIPARAAAIPAAVPAIHRRLPAPEGADLPAREALAAAFRERSAALKACLPGVRLTRLVPVTLTVSGVPLSRGGRVAGCAASDAAKDATPAGLEIPGVCLVAAGLRFGRARSATLFNAPDESGQPSRPTGLARLLIFMRKDGDSFRGGR